MATYRAEDVADWFLAQVDRAAGQSITHLKLQKLVYYAQAWYLANFNLPLFDEDIEAWAHGPVAPNLWRRHRNASWNSLPAPEHVPQFGPQEMSLLTKVFDAYGKYDAKFLEHLTHDEAPWKKARGTLAPEASCNTIISKELMRDFYGKQIKKTWKGSVAA